MIKTLLAAGISILAFNVFGFYQPEVAKGYTLSTYAEVPNARQMAQSSNGTLFVGSRSDGDVHAVLPNGKVRLIAEDLNMPSGLALNNKGDLYISAVNRIYRLQNAQAIAGNSEREITLERLTDKLPSDSHHGWKFISFDPNTNNLVVPVGAPCNVCLVYPNTKQPYGTILSLDINKLNQGKLDYTILAQGVRNSVGFDWHPQSKQLWFTDNGRDWFGDDYPPCEINRVTKQGAHFGFPFKHADLDETDEDILAKMPKPFRYESPVIELQAHSAPLGMMFYNGPIAHLKGALIVAEHGSWNRTKPVGYRVSAYWIKDNNVTKHEVLVNWLIRGKKLGRPVDIDMAPDGSLYISDDSADVIWQLSKSPN